MKRKIIISVLLITFAFLLIGLLKFKNRILFSYLKKIENNIITAPRITRIIPVTRLSVL